MSRFDFSVAKTKHLAWKSKLRGFLNGQETLTDTQAVSHEECDLGKWLYAEGLKKYGTIPEMRSLEKEHVRLHATVKRIVEFKNSGKTAAAEEELAKLDLISQQVVNLLTLVQEKES